MDRGAAAAARHSPSRLYRAVLKAEVPISTVSSKKSLRFLF
jgi:hypothetical protein